MARILSNASTAADSQESQFDIDRELSNASSVSSVPQFVGGGPTVRVRNTFIDFEDSDAKTSCLLKSRTAPAAVMEAMLSSEEEEEEQCEEEREASFSEEQDNEDNASKSTDTAQLQTSAGRSRIVRRNSRESIESWGWAGDTVMPKMLPIQMMVPVVTTVLAPMVPIDTTGDGMADSWFISSNNVAPACRITPPQMQPARGPEVTAVQRLDARSNEQGCFADPQSEPPKRARAQTTVESIARAASPQRVRARASTSIRHSTSLSSGCQRIFWTVDAKKIRGNDKQAVSPSFDLTLNGEDSSTPFKMMVYPEVPDNCEGGANFQTSRGRGNIYLKCEGALSQASAEVTFRFSIGNGRKATASRGPVSHDFTQTAVSGFPKGQDGWNFAAAVDRKSKTFVICLEIVPHD